MEKRNDKLIAEKINSLDNLPEGYHPNINSKWILLEETMGVRKRSFFTYKWLSIAAVILILFSAGVWYSSNEKRTSDTAEINITPVKNSTGEQNSFGEKVKQKVAAAENQKKTFHKRITDPESVKVSDDNNNQNTPDSEPGNIMTDESFQHTAMSTSITEQTEIVKHRKRRYIQMDFESSSSPFTLTKESNAQIIRIRIGSFNKVSADALPETGSALLLRQNF